MLGVREQLLRRLVLLNFSVVDEDDPVGHLMMLRYSFGMAEEADAIENAVSRVLDKGLRTADNMSDGCTCLGCTAMGDAILAELS